MHKGKACPEGKSIKLLREDGQNYEFVTPQAALLEKRSSHPLFTIPGVSSALCRGDSLHILYSRGVASHLAGSLLFYMCFFDGPGTRQKVSPTLRLQKIFSRIKELYVQNQVASRLTNLRLSMICDPNKPHKNFPVLEAKAAETKHFLPCLLAVIQEVLPPEEPIHEKMKICLAALVSIAGHFDSCGMFLSPKEFTTASNLGKRFFKTVSFHLEISFLHAFAEGLEVHELQVPPQLYKAEHFVGQMSVLAHSCSFGVKNLPSYLRSYVPNTGCCCICSCPGQGLAMSTRRRTSLDKRVLSA